MSTRTRGQIVSYSTTLPAQAGFTLIELLLVLAITAIIAALASPAISVWIESARAQTIQQQVASLLSDARYRALSKSEIVTVCRLEGKQCSGDFGFPLSAFVDSDRDAVWDSKEEKVYEIAAELPESAQWQWNRKGGFLRFWPNGGTGALTGSLSYCDSQQPENEFRIVIARTGRLRVDQKDSRCN